MRKKFLVFGAPLIEDKEIKEVVKTLRSGWLSTGPKVHKFETMFKEYIGTKFAHALNSCTAGLHLSMVAIGVGAGDEVITTPMTFCATANSIIHTGAKPVFVDIDVRSMNISAEKIKECIERKYYIDEKSGTPINKETHKHLRAIMPVHFAGRPADMDEIVRIARKYNLYIIEDAAHCIEGFYKGKKIGTIGDLTCFSFYATKNLVTGEGGMVTTDNKTFADRIETYGLHGMSRGAWHRYSDKGYVKYRVIYPGFKYNMMDIQASLGIHQLKKLSQYSKKREKIWNRYNEALKDLPITTPAPFGKEIVHARHLYTILIDKDDAGITRDELQQKLYRLNIGTGVHFSSLHLEPYYQHNFGYRKGDFPNAEYVSERTLSLPFSAKLSDTDVGDVIEALSTILK
ncbi:MAG: DegT/DnrJ/EryC1/StrS family aminotransferase [Candidatus Omnitrophica bacterium]|nr:DegT/DnrJ/EryC1/StrS family aminotransferase [Candidatus Omnitrophota bacterium]